MSSNLNERDPFYQAGQRYQQQATDRTMQNLHQLGETERAIQNRLSRFLVFGLPQLLWKFSRTALFLYVVPCWIYIFVIAAVTIGLHCTLLYAIVFYCLGTVFFFLMVGSMIYGFLKSLGFTRIISVLQIGVATVFTLVATYRAFNVPPRQIPYEPRSLECVIVMLVMSLLFIITVLTDLLRVFFNKQSME